MEHCVQTLVSGAYSLVIWLAPGLMAALGLCFFFVRIPRCRPLECYVRSRRIMATTFVLYGAAILLDEVSGAGMGGDFNVERLIVIAISAFQAFLFTSTLITLVDMSYFTVRRMVAESTAILAFLSVAFFVAFFAHGYAGVAFYVCAGIYAALLVRYVLQFRRHYAAYVDLMDSYYSADEDRHLLWVKRSFYWSLGIGLLALAYSFVPFQGISLLFMSAAISYYVFFGIRFINYTYDFGYYRQVIDVSGADAEIPPETVVQPPSDDERQIMQSIDRLVNGEEMYKLATLTVNVLSAKLGKSHRTVSAAISHCRNTNFKSYVNAMRVEEAARLISGGWLESHTIESLAAECGFTNRVSLYRVFKQQKGVAPTDFVVTKST